MESLLSSVVKLVCKAIHIPSTHQFAYARTVSYNRTASSDRPCNSAMQKALLNQSQDLQTRTVCTLMDTKVLGTILTLHLTKQVSQTEAPQLRQYLWLAPPQAQAALGRNLGGAKALANLRATRSSTKGICKRFLDCNVSVQMNLFVVADLWTDQGNGVRATVSGMRHKSKSESARSRCIGLTERITVVAVIFYAVFDVDEKLRSFAEPLSDSITIKFQ